MAGDYTRHFPRTLWTENGLGKKRQKKRATWVTPPIIRVHLLELNIAQGVGGVTPPYSFWGKFCDRSVLYLAQTFTLPGIQIF